MSAGSHEVSTFNVSAQDNPGALKVVRRLMSRPDMIAVGINEGRWMNGDEGLPDWDWVHVHPATPIWYPEKRGFDVNEKGGFRLSEATPIEKAAAGPTTSPEKWIQYVAGECDKKMLAVVETHYTPSIQFDKADTLNEAQVRKTVNVINMLRKRGFQVIFMADTNFTPSADNIEPLLHSGLILANRNVGGTHGKRLIDHIYVTPGIQVLDAWKQPGHRKDDHSATGIRFRLR